MAAWDDVLEAIEKRYHLAAPEGRAHGIVRENTMYPVVTSWRPWQPPLSERVETLCMRGGRPGLTGPGPINTTFSHNRDTEKS